MRGEDRRGGAAHAVGITGMGLFTPAGDGTEATWSRVCEGTPTAVFAEGFGPEGRSPVSPHPHIGCPAPGFDPARLGAARPRRPDRTVQLALLAAAEAVHDAGWADPALPEPPDWGGARVAVVMGCGASGAHTQETEWRALAERGPTGMSPYAVPSSLGNSAAAQLSLALGAEGTCFTVNTACAAGATAVGTAMDLLALGRCDIAVAGGADAGLTPFYVAGFDRIRALSRRYAEPAAASRPFDADRDGFVIGEGAGVLVLERLADARARGARVHARLVGYGAAGDAHHPVKPRQDGAGIAAAVREALLQVGAGPDEVGHVNAHATGTPLGDSVEAGALARLLPHGPPVSSTKGVTGHLLGAAGAVEAALAALAVARATVPPNANLTEPSPEFDLRLPTRALDHKTGLALSVSAGFGGHNAALALAPA
ncbi:beta-ketoacyl-[acyl-carrier-protein] synthase family protein [Streptomyces iconiensis]|uniref:Beta-ketoacyl-[acyl-carrier-protein] synthase family protein n=1 Tax=Streptomyces iconiensis TaxID=1384038 RepID=A0ABT7A7K4_9ACTN|nr:beta-ketoacyl-[acyl-carrier-protein] synthase family protein [Streptomyces iconiensis]MDJ1137327.1 beta-ketoacyl-[acyl-carrier-protein] synthase family protein [Streptomyces iconiensis]